MRPSRLVRPSRSKPVRSRRLWSRAGGRPRSAPSSGSRDAQEQEFAMGALGRREHQGRARLVLDSGQIGEVAVLPGDRRGSGRRSGRKDDGDSGLHLRHQPLPPLAIDFGRERRGPGRRAEAALLQQGQGPGGREQGRAPSPLPRKPRLPIMPSPPSSLRGGDHKGLGRACLGASEEDEMKLSGRLPLPGGALRGGGAAARSRCSTAIARSAR